MAKRRIHLGLSVGSVGYHYAAWRLPEIAADGAMQFSHYRRCAQLAEAGLFDFMFVADTASVRMLDKPEFARNRLHDHVRHEPFALMAALSAITKHVGFLPTVSTTYADPYNTARAVGTLDHLSHGRALWNIVTGFCNDEARNYGLEALPSAEDRMARASEFIEVVNGLFDSWDDDAVVRDKASGLFFDRSKMHLLEHRGPQFKVKGPLDMPPLPQRRPPLVAAGTSAPSMELAAKYADLVYAGKVTIADAKAYYADLKGRMAKYGRRREELRILPGVMVYVGRTRQEAQDKFDRLQDYLTDDMGIGLLRAYGLPDYTGYDLGAPVPDLPAGADLFGQYATDLMARAKREGLSPRDMYKMIGGGFWSLRAIGTAADIADMMEEWVTEEAADGFMFQPPYLPIAVEDFVELVVPELQRRGLHRTAYEPGTLRERMGLQPAVSRYARVAAE